ncbi:MAG: sialate O-acetylesterase [Bacteroidaceae bacterium]|nr:sialate O-acetylesterase [Bacteroidaceae bacterium]
MRNIGLFFALMASLSAGAKVKLPALLCDNMVLQQNSDARLWGEAEAKSKISVTTSWTNEVYSTYAGADGKWCLSIKTPEASFEAQSVTIMEGKADKITLRDVLIGEVWLASGQSNMEMPLKGFPGCCVKDGAHDAMYAMRESPYVRMFNVKQLQSYRLVESCKGQWMKPTFSNALEFSATAYYFAASLSNALQVPVGIVNSSYGGSHVESWTPKDILETYPDIPTDSVGVYSFGQYQFDRPLVLYNGMFNPIKNFTYKGIIWYQGCGNVGHADTYAERLKNMVERWRKDMNLGDIPFYYVEIAPYMFGDGKSIEGALLREAQYKAQYLIPNSDLISTNDLVEPIEVYNIHPRQKRTVGLRLALLAMNKTYGMSNLPCSGPRYDKSKFRIVDGKAIVGFTSLYMGICRNYGLTGFEIAGEDRVFYPANAEFHWQTNEVYLTSDSVPHPVAVRYCFKDFQIGNLIGGNELPLFPFRTDNW